MNYFLIKDGKVVNKVVCDPSIVAILFPGFIRLEESKAPVGCNIGWGYDGEKPIPPEPK